MVVRLLLFCGLVPFPQLSDSVGAPTEAGTHQSGCHNQETESMSAMKEAVRRTVLSLPLAATILLSTLSAAVAYENANGVGYFALEVKDPGSMVIDGIADDWAWFDPEYAIGLDQMAITLGGPIPPPSDIDITIMAGWSPEPDNRLYLFVQVLDDTLHIETTILDDAWKEDNLGIIVDADHGEWHEPANAQRTGHQQWVLHATGGGFPKLVHLAWQQPPEMQWAVDEGLVVAAVNVQPAEVHLATDVTVGYEVSMPAWDYYSPDGAVASTRHVFVAGQTIGMGFHVDEGDTESWRMNQFTTYPQELGAHDSDFTSEFTMLADPPFVVPLSPGYNLVSLGEPSANDSITTLMAPIMGNLARVIGFETDAINPNSPEIGGKLYSPSLSPFINTLKLTDFHLAYWLVMSAADTLVAWGVPAKIVSSVSTGDGELHPVYDFMGIHGRLQVDGEPAPIGTRVEVTDAEGTLAGRFEVHHEGYYGFLPIYRDDAGTPVDEGADMGEWLSIQVNGQPTAQRVQWTAFGDEVRLDLEATSQVASLLPTEFVLAHNYPNPFNPSTTIKYQLPSEQEVVLSIWNLAGQLVRELVHTRQAAGNHLVTWDARDESGGLVANGVYLYRIRAGDFQSARKMVLMK